VEITVTGMGYVGLVTAACFAESGHHVTCFDTDNEKIASMKMGEINIVEPGLLDMIVQNFNRGLLTFTSDPKEAYQQPTCVFITVGTPAGRKGEVDLSFIYDSINTLATCLRVNTIIAIKSTVPVGTCEKIHKLLKNSLPNHLNAPVVSNPEFLREGSGIYDTIQADRIIIGTNENNLKEIFDEIYQPFHVPIVYTDIKSAELIKYASNAFLATKISFINEIATICEKTGADIREVAYGMGLDHRIGNSSLQAGIGYGGSCFPKDTLALERYSEDLGYQFEILKGTIAVNNRQLTWPLQTVKTIFPSLKGIEVAVLGLSFKPNTDDLRGAPSLEIIKQLQEEGAKITVYDPVAYLNFKKIDPIIQFATTLEEAIIGKQVAIIVTEWSEIKEFELVQYVQLMKTPIVIDGRNCYSLKQAEQTLGLSYYSVGRMNINPEK
jgi:UDPglucose 6-dehydrogenase